jgi:uncharacterized SAM-binding protein YcdF (DUF218 family)
MLLYMFTSPYCTRSFNSVPLSFDFGAWNGLKLPLLLVIVFVLIRVAIALVRILRRGNRQRHLRHRRPQSFKSRLGKLFKSLSFCLLGLLLLLAIAEQGLTAFLPTDPGTPADAIVMLGRGPQWQDSRIAVSVDLWRASRAPLIFASGVYDAPILLRKLAAQGVPQTALDGEDCSLTTPENALFTSTILRARGLRTIILVTDRFHLWRSLQDFKSQGLQVIPRPSPVLDELSWVDRSILVLRESVFLISARVYEGFRGQRIAGLSSPSQVDLLELAKQYGKSNRN